MGRYRQPSLNLIWIKHESGLPTMGITNRVVIVSWSIGCMNVEIPKIKLKQFVYELPYLYVVHKNQMKILLDKFYVLCWTKLVSSLLKFSSCLQLKWVGM